MLKLAIEESDWTIDWSDPDEVGKLKIGDLACGTGTLLKAALESIVGHYVEETVSQGKKVELDRVHKLLMEEGIRGFDVLASAAHLAATAIAMHNPSVRVEGMGIHVMPLGGRGLYLGSIEFAQNRRFNVQRTLLGASIGAQQATGQANEVTSVELPEFDIIAMNPPFTRSVYGNFLFGSVLEEERPELQRKLQQLVRRINLQANITAGLGSVFVAIVDRLIKDKGILALVLPKTVLEGVTWQPTRDIMHNYNLRYIVVSHEPNNWNFSESTYLSEVLLVLQKHAPAIDSQTPTKFVNLWEQPRTSVEALSLTRSIMQSTPADITSNAGTCELKTNSRKYGEMVILDFEDNPNISWGLPVAFAQTDLCRVAYNLFRGVIFLPGIGAVGHVNLVRLDRIAILGPDGRDIYDGFNESSSRSPYRALWGIDSNSVRNVNQRVNKYLIPLTRAKPGRSLRDANLLWSRAGSLMLPKELRLTTNRLAAVTLTNEALSNVWWPTRWLGDNNMICRAMERRLALWFNSTLGLLSMLMNRQETFGSFVKFPKAWWEALPVLDLMQLNKSKLKALDKLWEEIENIEFQPFPSMKNDSIRCHIDNVMSKVLGIPNIDAIRGLLAREPIISMQSLI